MDTRRRGAVGAVLAGLLLSALGSPVARADTSPPPAPAPAVLAPLTPSAAMAPTPDGVAAEIGRLVRRELAGGSVLVTDPATGTVLYQRGEDRPLIPASTTKLTTAVAALDVLGPQTRIPTIAYREGATVYLVGGGDPTLVRAKGGNPLAGGSASLRDLARATAAEVSGPVDLVFDTSAFRGPRLGPGWPSSFPSAGVVAPVAALTVDGGRVRPGATARVADPARQAADVFADLLAAQGVQVTATRKGRLADGATEVARVESPPVADIVERMLTESENNYAEALAHLAGGVSLDKPTFAGGAAAATLALEELGVDVTGVDLQDGSGLSRGNRLPAARAGHDPRRGRHGDGRRPRAHRPGAGGRRLHRHARRPVHQSADPARPRLRPRQDRDPHRGRQPGRHRARLGRSTAGLRDDRERCSLTGRDARDYGPDRQSAGDLRMHVAVRSQPPRRGDTR